MVFKMQMQLGPMTARNIVGVVFFGGCCLNSILLFKFAQNMRFLMMTWMSAEAALESDTYQLPLSSWVLSKRIACSLIVYLFSSLLEHALYMSSEIHSMFHDIAACNVSDINYLELFLSRHLPFIVENLPFEYNSAVWLTFEYLNFSYTFFWNFLDLFVILVSCGVIVLFEKMNWRIANFRGLMVNESVWAEIRLHHVQITELLKLTSQLIGPIVVAAYCINGYFILVQLLNITMWVLLSIYMIASLPSQFLLQLASVSHQQNLFLVFVDFPLVQNRKFNTNGIENSATSSPTAGDFPLDSLGRLERGARSTFPSNRHRILCTFWNGILPHQ